MTNTSLTGNPNSVGELVAQRWYDKGIAVGAAQARQDLEAEIIESLAAGDFHSTNARHDCDGCRILRMVWVEFRALEAGG